VTHVPVVFLDHLTDLQADAYMLADNKLTDRSTWDDTKVAKQLKELTELALEFDIEATGFELPEIDIRIQSLQDTDNSDRADEFELISGPPVSTRGDLWTLGPHLILCGSALENDPYSALFEKEKATAVFTDPPYNVPIDGHVSGTGRTKHREFPMATGEMSAAQFTDFLTATLRQVCAHSTPGALIYACIGLAPPDGDACRRPSGGVRSNQSVRLGQNQWWFGFALQVFA
jgi:hypothetical protein